MKSLMLLWQVVANEYGDRCCTSTALDFKTVKSRVESEGLSFLTISLPQFCKDFERSLDRGFVARDLFHGFRWKGGLPAFLQGFLEQIFDSKSGRLVDTPSIESIRAVRQLALLLSKLELETTPEREARAMRGFIDCEREVKEEDEKRGTDLYDQFQRISLLVWGNVLSKMDKILYDEHRGPSDDNVGWPFLRPKHGPGATADRLSGNRKYDLTYWPERLERVFPYVEYAIPGYKHYYRLYRVDFREPGSELPVRVITVPKTPKTPRIIAIEPTAMQYMQQALSTELVRAIESDPLFKHVVGFKDQWRNRVMAREASLTGKLATLDLSEASDRVSNQLVRTMLARFPHFDEAVQATRSLRADVQGHGVITLSKFASMGSAMTFPIEAMVFTTVIFCGLENGLGRRLTQREVKSFLGLVRVYGDDIIVPTDFVRPVVEALEAFGFKVNSNKSFWTGGFRESCGREYYAGEDVSVVKVRHVDKTSYELPTTLQAHADLIESFVSLRNNFYVSGLWRTAAWLDKRIDTLFRGVYPCIAVTRDPHEDEWYSRSNVLGRWSFLGYQPERTHRGHQALLVRGYVARTKLPASIASDLGSLHKVLTRGPMFDSVGQRVLPDEDHLRRAGRSQTVSIKSVFARPD